MRSFGLVAPPPDPTTGLDVFAAVSPLLAALLAVGGVVWTVVSNNQRERSRQEQERLLARDRQEHERLLKEAELEGGRESRLREEQIAAYRKMLAASAHAHGDDESLAAISEAYAEVSLIAGSDKLDEAAMQLWLDYGKANSVRRNRESDGEPDEDYVANFMQALETAIESKKRFIELAREELGVKGRSTVFRDNEGYATGETLPDSEAGTSKP